jgi:hypothetical protein
MITMVVVISAMVEFPVVDHSAVMVRSHDVLAFMRRSQRRRPTNQRAAHQRGRQ